MQSQPTENASAKDETSTIDDIKALAPVTEEWFKAKARQYSAGKKLVAAEWDLAKKSFLVAVMFLLLFTSFTTVLLIVTNVAIAYALIQTDIHWLLITAIVISLNLFCTVLCWKTVKRVGANISLRKTKQVITGKGDTTEETDDE